MRAGNGGVVLGEQRLQKEKVSPYIFDISRVPIFRKLDRRNFFFLDTVLR